MTLLHFLNSSCFSCVVDISNSFKSWPELKHFGLLLLIITTRTEESPRMSCSCRSNSSNKAVVSVLYCLGRFNVNVEIPWLVSSLLSKMSSPLDAAAERPVLIVRTAALQVPSKRTLLRRHNLIKHLADSVIVTSYGGWCMDLVQKSEKGAILMCV